MLQPVSETFQEERFGVGPVYDVRYPTPGGFDLSDHHQWTKGHPFDYYKVLREQAPVAWFDVGAQGGGFWAITRYDDIKATELNPEVFSSQRGGINMAYGDPRQRVKRLHGAALNTLICLDRPYHIDLRMQHRDFFTPQYVQSLQARVDEKVDELLDNMEKAARKNGGKADLVEHVSAQLPLFTLCEMLGIEEKDRPLIIKWMHYLERAAVVASKGSLLKVNPVFVAKFLWNIRQMFNYGDRVLEERRANPGNDLMSRIATATIGNELLTHEFLEGAWLLIIFAGNDTSRNSISGAMRLLTENPDQKQKVLDDRSLMTNMISESIRMTTPVIHMRRTATQDTEIAGQKIAEGEKVIMYYGAANRDPSVFENPDQFDVTRENAKDHLAFGHGPHVCLGQRIANMQLEAAYRQLLERFPNIKWTGKQDIAPNNFVHAVNSLEVDLGVN